MEITIIIGLVFLLLWQMAKHHEKIKRHANGLPYEGEDRVDKALKKELEKKYYYVASNITLPFEDGTTQIDHVVISYKGIFVIETKNYNGTVYTNSGQHWYQYIGRKKYAFQNPHRQNHKHILAIKSILTAIPDDLITGEVIFVGRARLQEIPENTHTNTDSLINKIKSKESKINKKTMIQAIGAIEYFRKYDCEKTNTEHQQYIATKNLKSTFD